MSVEFYGTYIRERIKYTLRSVEIAAHFYFGRRNGRIGEIIRGLLKHESVTENRHYHIIGVQRRIFFAESELQTAFIQSSGPITWIWAPH